MGKFYGVTKKMFHLFKKKKKKKTPNKAQRYVMYGRSAAHVLASSGYRRCGNIVEI